MLIMNNPASSTAVVQYIEEMNLHALGFPGFYPKNLFQTKLYNSRIDPGLDPRLYGLIQVNLN